MQFFSIIRPIKLIWLNSWVSWFSQICLFTWQRFGQSAKRAPDSNQWFELWIIECDKSQLSQVTDKNRATVVREARIVLQWRLLFRNMNMLLFVRISLDSIGASIWGGRGPDPPTPEIWPGRSGGPCVPVNYPQAPLIKRLVFVLYDGYSWKYKCVAQSVMGVKQLVTMDGTGGH